MIKLLRQNRLFKAQIETIVLNRILRETMADGSGKKNLCTRFESCVTNSEPAASKFRDVLKCRTHGEYPKWINQALKLRDRVSEGAKSVK